MSRVVCQVVPAPEITFRWSCGDKHFEPYQLTAEASARLRDLSFDALNRLELLLLGDAPAAAGLASLGHEMYKLIFPAAGPAAGTAAEVRQWLGELHGRGDVRGFEVTGATTIPWNLVYDTPPADGAFADAPPYADCWRPFWGVRYPLAVTHRVNPFRGVELLQRPAVLVAVDPYLRSQMSVEQRGKFDAYLAGAGFDVVESCDDLAAALEDSPPDVLHVLARCRGEALVLGEVPWPAARLRQWLTAGESPPAPWNNFLLFVHPVAEEGAADDGADGWYAVRAELDALRCAGLVCPEVPTADADLAAAFAADVMERFLSRSDPLGEAVQNARSAVAPAGLTYTTGCPPHLQVSWSDEPPAAADGPAWPPLPAEPYHPLVPLDAEQRALLVGREEDIAAVAGLLDSPETRLVLLHGRGGIGKASLLRAGVIPALEEDGCGYLALRDRTEAGGDAPPPVIAVRCTNDLAGQLALALSAYASRPYTFTTPAGREVTVDLADVLRRAVQGEGGGAAEATGITAADPGRAEAAAGGTPPAGPVEPLELAKAFAADPGLFDRVLQEFGRRLPHDPVVLIEQGEELYSLSRDARDVRHRNTALAVLREVMTRPGHGKVLFSMRTEYAARLETRLWEGIPAETDPVGVAEYLLPALTRRDLADVVARPTLDEPIPFAAEVPLERYGFAYDEGLPEQIARQALECANDGTAEALPLVQAVCALLHRRAAGRADPRVTWADYAALGGRHPDDTGVAASPFFKEVMGFLGLAPADRPGLAEAQRQYLEQRIAGAVGHSDRSSAAALLSTLVRTQADGGLVRDLVPAREVAARWQGRVKPGAMLEALTDPENPVLTETVVLTDGGEQSALSLGSDSLLPAAAEYAAQRRERAAGGKRMADALWVCIPLMILGAVAAYYLGILPARQRAAEAQQATEEAEGQKALLGQIANGRLWAAYLGRIREAQAAVDAGDTFLAQRLLQSSVNPQGESLRSFDWFHLKHEADPSAHSFPPHEGAVTSLSTHASGKLALSAGADGDVILRGGPSAHPITLMRGERGGRGPRLAVFSPDGHAIAVTAGGQVRLWGFDFDDKTGRITAQQKAELAAAEGGPVGAVAFAPDSKTVYTGGADGAVRAWSVPAGDEAGTLAGHKAPVSHLAASPDGKLLASAAGGRVLLHDTATKKISQEIKDLPGDVTALAFAPDGKSLAVAAAGDGAAVQLRDPAGGDGAGKSIGQPAPAGALLFTADGKTLITGGRDKVIRLWDVASGGLRKELRGHLGAVTSLALTGGGEVLISGGRDGTVRYWNLAEGPDRIEAFPGGLTAFALSPDGKLVAAGSDGGVVKVWDQRAGKLLHTLEKGKGRVLGLAFVPGGDKADNPILAAATAGDGDKSALTFWDLGEGKVKFSVPEVPGRVGALAGAPAGGKVAAGVGKSILVWQPGEAEPKYTLQRHTDAVHALAFSPDGQALAAGDDSGTVLLWDVQSGAAQPITSPGRTGEAGLTRHVGPVRSVAFFPVGRLLITGGADGTVRIWMLARSAEALAFESHGGPVEGVAFGPAGQLAVSAGADGTVRLWDLKEGQLRAAYNDGHGPVVGAGFTPNRDALISAGSDGTIRIRRASPG